MKAGTGAAFGRIGDLMGQARLSTVDQTVALQLHVLHAARCK